MRHTLLYILLLCLSLPAAWGNRQGTLRGQVVDAATGEALPLARLRVLPEDIRAETDASGHFYLDTLVPHPDSRLVVQYMGFLSDTLAVQWDSFQTIKLQADKQLEEVVITGTMRAVSRKESPIPVEVYRSAYFKTNPTPSLLEATGMINGVRPQVNCNVCNTGDIHINGMEGPYTLVLIDGMPIVSALSTVYGLSGIPNSMVQQLEVVKGPAAALYGSEAMGGIINVITKSPQQAPRLSVELMGTSWQEFNADLGAKASLGKRVQTLLGIHSFWYNQPFDKNKDGFTDLALQKRVSVFNKWAMQRPHQRVATLGLRYVYEDRWGGQTDWDKRWRGTDSIYGEHVLTRRWELIGQYQLPAKEHVMLQYSFNHHLQDSWYGTSPYAAQQTVAFAQLYWNRNIQQHELLAGATYRYTYYDDNTPATVTARGNNPQHTPLPGLFVQDEWTLNARNKLLAGYRFDYDRHHGGIHSPRLAYKWQPHRQHSLRASVGTGFRVVNIFTEDHAALTGARTVVIKEALAPERSYNTNLNYAAQFVRGAQFINLDATLFYSYFTNKIIADYDTDPNIIYYGNLNGHSTSRGVSLNASWHSTLPLQVSTGITFMEVFRKEGRQREQLLFAPQWSGNVMVGYTLPGHFRFDLTAQWNGPMRLPLQPNDYRPEYSPWFCLANLQVTKTWNERLELFGGIKNLLNFVPKEVYMRPWDPFDKYTDQNNPENFTFDTSYNYAPQQGIRGFLGIRYQL